MKKRKVNPVAKFFVKLLGNEKYQVLTIPVFAILLSLIVGAVVIAALGKDPVSAYRSWYAEFRQPSLLDR